MKKENIDTAISLCSRINKLQGQLSTIEYDRDLAVIITHYWDGSSPIVKDGISTKEDNDTEAGLFQDLLTTLKGEIIYRIKTRIDFLTYQLDKL